MAAPVSMKTLLEAGVHFGHQTRRWDPKMKQFIFTERNGIHIIDLQQTVGRLGEAMSFVRDLAGSGGVVLFVGTKKQAQETIEQEATRCSMPYVNQRWMGGMLTNFQTIQTRIKRLSDLEARRERGEFERLPKKEAGNLGEEIAKLTRLLGGMRRLVKLPTAVFVVDPNRESIAVAEARRLDLPLVAMVDTNCNPDVIDYPIPANDDAIRAIRLLASKIADAVLEGVQRREAELSKAEAEAELAAAEGEAVSEEEAKPEGEIPEVEAAMMEAARVAEAAAQERAAAEEAATAKAPVAEPAVEKAAAVEPAPVEEAAAAEPAVEKAAAVESAPVGTPTAEAPAEEHAEEETSAGEARRTKPRVARAPSAKSRGSKGQGEAEPETAGSADSAESGAETQSNE